MAADPTQPGGRRPDLLGPEENADIPPPPYGLAADPLDEDDRDRLDRMSRRDRMLPGLLVVAAIGAFVAIVWWAYRSANEPEAPGEVPMVEAEPGDVKVRPESEGGMDVPNQDKLIYQQLGEAGGEPEVERLLPPPEEPLAPPAPETAEPASETADLTPPPPPQETPDEVEGDAPAEAAAVPQADQPASAGGTEPGAATDVAEAPPAPEPAPAAEQPAAEAPAEPAPAVEAPAAEEPAPQVAAAGAFRIQLAAVKSEDAAHSEWARLQKAHGDLLGGLEPTIQRADLGAQGVFYRIQGGPLPSRDAADALCGKLEQKDQPCLVVTP